MVPDDWRKGYVTPIYRKESKEDPGNYRLVCHLSAWEDHGTDPPG